MDNNLTVRIAQPPGVNVSLSAPGTLYAKSLNYLDFVFSTGVETPNAIVKRDANGLVNFTTARTVAGAAAIYATATGASGTYAIDARGTNGSGGIVVRSVSTAAATISSSGGTYHATFGDSGIDRSFVARDKGAFGWFRNDNRTARIHPPNTITANRTYTLPDTDGTVALTNDSRLAEVDAATSTATPNTLVKRSPDSSADFYSVSAESEVICKRLTVYDQADQPVIVTGYSGAITVNSNAGEFTIGLDKSFAFFDGNYSYSYFLPSAGYGTIALSSHPQTFTSDQIFSEIVSLSNPEQSTSFFTGALRMIGGACIGKNLNVGGATGTAASTTTTAGLKVPHGTAPASPVNGDVWTTTAGSFIRINGTTRQTATLSGTQSFSGNQTFAGTAAFTNAARPTSSATEPPQETSLMTRNDVDARFGTPYNLRVLTDVSATSLSNVNSSDTITLPAGTYFFQGNILGLTASTTAGISVTFFTNSDTNTTGSAVFQSSSNNGTGSTPTMVPRSGSTLFQYLATAFADAPLKACSSIFSGTVTFSTSQTITPRVSQQTVADANNAAILKAGSIVRFIKIA